MKTIVLLSLLLSLICKNESFGQFSVFGKYEENIEGQKIIDLKPNGMFFYNSLPPCGLSPCYIDSGKWVIWEDTNLYLFKNNSYFMRFKFNKDGNLNQIVSPYECIQTTFQDGNYNGKIIKIDTFISDISLFTFYKKTSYDSSGNIEWIKVVQDYKTIKMTYYYPNGSIKAEGLKKWNKRQGTWKYYDENGNIYLKEKYKYGTLKKSKIINLPLEINKPKLN